MAIQIVSTNIKIIGLNPTHFNFEKFDFMPIAAMAVTKAKREKLMDGLIIDPGRLKPEFTIISTMKATKKKGTSAVFVC
tara:strand:+ start:625 stop:861 length:237 start_codon:yes stop_codon:yes gene_type:complete